MDKNLLDNEYKGYNMPGWLTAVIAIFTALGGSTLMSIIWNKIADAHAERREKDKEEKLNAQRIQSEEEAKKRHDEMITEVQNMLTPIHTELTDIRSGLEKNTKGTVSSLRANMMLLRDQFREKGYASGNDKAAWNQLYNDYQDLGGNHFREYVDQWKEEVNSMVEEKPVDNKKSK